jgi:1-phosphofructokinase/tagatose 6-phosphate kinase
MITTLCLSPAADKIFLIDDFEPGRLHRAKAGDIYRSAGGKGLNAARVLAALGEKVQCLGFIAGGTGEWLRNEAEKAGVHTAFISVEGETRTNINIIDRNRSSETELLEPGPVIVKSSAEAFLCQYERLLPGTRVLVCSGGLPEGLPSDFYKTLVEMAKKRGIKVILDSSGQPLQNGVKAKPYLIKPNLRELRNLSGQKLEDLDEIIRACRDIISDGTEVVAASMGVRGAVLVTGSRCVRALAGNIPVVNTIGSGDSLVAGLAAGISRGDGLEEAFRTGMACAAVNAQYMEIGRVDRYLVEGLKPNIELVQL